MNRQQIRKIISILTALTLLFALAGCGGKSGNADKQTGETEKGSVNELNNIKVRVGSLKGPTSIGLVSLMKEAEKGDTKLKYDNFTIAAAADELTAKFIKGELDIVLVPANVASVLYNKTDGQVKVLDINTLGVLYMVTGTDNIKSMEDLKGRTVYLTGKGTTPDFVLQYLLEKNGIGLSEVTLEYKSEASEVAAILSENPEAVGLLPQPFVTVALGNNDKLKTVLDLTEEWENVQGDGGGSLVTGVTIARAEFVKENPEAVEEFIKEHKKSTGFTETNPDETAEYVVELGIVKNAAIAKKAIPGCNIVCITGDEMKASLSKYLEVLYNSEPKSVGGKLPSEDFYY